MTTINEEQRLYVMPCGKGYSCLGFDVLERRCVALMRWLVAHDQNFSAPQPEPFGTLARYEQYESALATASKLCARRNIRCDIELTKPLIGMEGKRVEVTSKDGEKRRFYVGKSSGWMPCHLEIARRDSSGGLAVMWSEGSTVRVI